MRHKLNYLLLLCCMGISCTVHRYTQAEIDTLSSCFESCIYVSKKVILCDCENFTDTLKIPKPYLIKIGEKFDTVAHCAGIVAYNTKDDAKIIQNNALCTGFYGYDFFILRSDSSFDIVTGDKKQIKELLLKNYFSNRDAQKYAFRINRCNKILERHKYQKGQFSSKFFLFERLSGKTYGGRKLSLKERIKGWSAPIIRGVYIPRHKYRIKQ